MLPCRVWKNIDKTNVIYFWTPCMILMQVTSTTQSNSYNHHAKQGINQEELLDPPYKQLAGNMIFRKQKPKDKHKSVKILVYFNKSYRRYLYLALCLGSSVRSSVWQSGSALSFEQYQPKQPILHFSHISDTFLFLSFQPSKQFQPYKGMQINGITLFRLFFTTPLPHHFHNHLTPPMMIQLICH